MTKDLEQLREKRLRWIDANRENDFEDGIKRLLTNLYPDNAHFIYELLQNAEDQHASVACFTLTHTSIEFEHNSANLFTFANIEDITSIGNSHKRDDPTNIGKFGVGFKAVFAYTNTPEIHSGQCHFRIHDLVVPQVEGVSSELLGDTTTRFLFPFDNPDKPAERARNEIEQGLAALSDNTLLFLSHIRKIEYLLPDSSFGSLERIEHECGSIPYESDRPNDLRECEKVEFGHWTKIEIRSTRVDRTSLSSHWLRFHNDVKVEDEEGRLTPCRIAVAYRLQQSRADQDGARWSIIPVTPGEVSIYFPAEKETSRLRFHLHAPFASTVARDSVRSCAANDALRDHLAQLLANSTPTIRDLGYLDVPFLAVLPNPGDTLSPFYEPLRVTLVATFNNKALVPARSGGHVPAGKLVRSPAHIARVLTDRDITILSGKKMCVAANPTQLNQREDQFLKSLGVRDWSWEDLDRALSKISRKAILHAWLARKSDEGIKELYELLKHSLAEDRYYDRWQREYRTNLSVSHLDLVRSRSSAGTKMCRVTDSFFQDGPDSSRPSDIYFVLPQYCNGESKVFLEQIGVKPYDAKIIVAELLERYRNPCVVCEQHFDDIRRFVAFSKKFPSETAVFQDFAFLLAESGASELVFRRPSGLYIAAPYANTFLDVVFEDNQGESLAPMDERALRLSTAYLEHDIDREHFLAFAKVIGVRWRLEVIKSSTQSNPDCARLQSSRVDKGSYKNLGRIDVDFTIQYIDKLLLDRNQDSSLLIWKTMTEAVKPENLIARYQYNNVSQQNTAPSLLVHQLKEAEWVPQRDRRFVKPFDARISELPEGFSYDSGAAWLQAIDFGRNEAEQTKEFRAREDVAKGLGLDSGTQLSELVHAMRDAGLTLEDIRALAANRRHVLPNEAVTDPDRRRNALLEVRESTQPRQRVLIERTTERDFGAVTNEAKPYLRARYKTVDDRFPCQCCRQEMPFRFPNNEHFFETIQCVRGLDHDFYQNRLALCPTCAAMYHHVRETDDPEIRRRILEADADDRASSVEISVRLAGVDFSLYFVGTHWFDLKTLLCT